jgi:hypothetical protein
MILKKLEIERFLSQYGWLIFAVDKKISINGLLTQVNGSI